jgi:dUTP pyrophosphatase
MDQTTLNHEQIAVSTIADKGVELPCYASTGASGADVKAFITQDLTIPAGGSALIPTGLRFAIPHGFEIQVRPRSGLALNHQLSVLNTPGTIDADYRGELRIILMNFGKNDFVVTPGMRIAQLVLAPVVQATFLEAQELAKTVRGGGGFGHTGIQ